jgi:hypothetical protein
LEKLYIPAGCFGLPQLNVQKVHKKKLYWRNCTFLQDAPGSLSLMYRKSIRRSSIGEIVHSSDTSKD